MIHGGFWRPTYDLTHASHLCAALARTGISVASLEYRRAGWPATFKDVIAGFAAAVKGIAPVVMGHSAGGHLALRLASEKLEIGGVVALAPVACVTLGYEENLGSGAVADFLGGKPDEIPDLYADADPVRHSSSVRRVLIHGTNDDVVPIANSRAYLEARREDPGGVRLAEVAGADHFDLIDPSSRAWAVVLANVKQMLGEV
jgi:acetyl esterase/lipase